MNETRICTKCKKELPLTNEYFTRDKNTSTGFASACKICKGDATKYGVSNNFKWTPEMEEYLIELYFHHTYEWIIENIEEFKSFTVKRLHNKMYNMRKIKPELDLYKDDKYRDLEYVSWTQEQVDKLIELYPDYTNNELLEMEIFKCFTVQQIMNKVKYLDYKNGIKLRKTDESISKTSFEGGSKIKGIPRTFSEEHRKNMSISKQGKWKGELNPQFGKKRVGKLNPNWKGGITPLYWELRTQIDEWKSESMKNCNYKCVITNKNFDVVHHLYPFRKIVDETFEELGIDIRQNVENYNNEEFNLICNKIKELHIKYGLGLCLTNDVHKQFHDIYGYKDFTEENFIEYCDKYHNIKLEQKEMLVWQTPKLKEAENHLHLRN